MVAAKRGNGKGDRPKKTRPNALPAPEKPRSYDKSTPVFCLAHIDPNFSVTALPEKNRAEFALALQQRCALNWGQLKQADRRGMGLETIRASSIKGRIPRLFQDQEKFVAFRYCGNLPMVGHRVNDVFHVLWVEGNFNDLYDHGG